MKKIINKLFVESNIKKKLGNIVVQVAIFSLMTFAVLHITFVMSVFNFKYDYKIGDTVSSDIVLTSDYLDIEATNDYKEISKYDVEKIYLINVNVYESAKEDISDFYNQAYEIREEYSEEKENLINFFTFVLKKKFNLTIDELELLGRLDDVSLKLTESYLYDVLKETLSDGITEENYIKSKQSVEDYFDDIEDMESEIKSVLIKIANFNIRINSYVDEEATEKAITEYIDSLENIVIQSGTILLEENKKMDKKTYKIINERGENNLHTFKQKIPLFSMDLFVFLILLLFNVILKFMYSKNKKKKSIFMNFVIFNFGYLLTFISLDLSMFLLPIASVAMLITILEGAYSGIIYSVFLALLLSVIFGIEANVLVIIILGNILSSLLVYKTYQRGKIFIAGIIISLINLVGIVAISLIEHIQFAVAIEHIFFGVISGILCSIITIGSLPIWETMFKILTPIKLLELANPNHPLLKKMLLEAPGTYHHSILVGNLSEAAAHDIGANALLARVGAYFHDIGKIDKPFFFSENQYDKVNPHDQLVPRVSAKLIIDHVTRGIEIGKQHKLPNEIISFIEQHHGTTLVAYFYYKATDSVKDNSNSILEIEKDAYTYPGPIPSRKEIAIVMLADSVEAAVRSLKKPNKENISELIAKIVESKIKANQLLNSDLTIGEIDIIIKSFISNLTSAFHERIEYPELKENIN